MTIEKLSEILRCITKNTDVVGFTVAEYLPFDEHRLHKMFAEINLFIDCQIQLVGMFASRSASLHQSSGGRLFID